MKADAIVTFMKNTNPLDPVVPSNTPIFSIPYSKIMQAQEFCKNEELEYCYIGFRKYNWHINVIPKDLDPAIKITQYGIHQETSDKFLYCLTEDN